MLSDPEARTLGERAVKARGFRWLPGMLLLTPAGPQRLGEHAHSGAWFWSGWEGAEPVPHGSVPDLRDPATLGCLLALVREAWGADTVVYLTPEVEPHIGGRVIWTCNVSTRRKEDLLPTVEYAGATEPEALVAALESAP